MQAIEDYKPKDNDGMYRRVLYSKAQFQEEAVDSKLAIYTGRLVLQACSNSLSSASPSINRYFKSANISNQKQKHSSLARLLTMALFTTVKTPTVTYEQPLGL